MQKHHPDPTFQDLWFVGRRAGQDQAAKQTLCRSYGGDEGHVSDVCRARYRSICGDRVRPDVLQCADGLERGLDGKFPSVRGGFGSSEYVFDTI